jgi:Tol biopolymer transport system component
MKTSVRTTTTLRALTAGLVLTFAGCCSKTYEKADEAKPLKEPAAPPAVVELGWEATGPSEANKASTLNIFGEFDGEHGHAVKQSGEAGFQQHTYLDEGYDTDVTVDPTGQYLLFASTRHNEHPDLYLQRVDGLSVTQLTNDAADDAFPCFSPDGKKIAFASTRSGSWQIFTMDADGRNVEQVTNGLSHAVHPSFSPDGKKLAYSALGGRSNQWELWIVTLATGERKMIGQGLFPAWCPDKTVNRIAFQKPRQRGSRWFSLWTLDLTDGEARRITEVAASTNAAVISPTWSPDGKKLAFATVVDPNRDQAKKGQQDIWVINADGSGRKRITDGTGSSLSPFWASDSRLYFVSDRGGLENIWSAHVDGGMVEHKVAEKATDQKDPFANEKTATTAE